MTYQSTWDLRLNSYLGFRHSYLSSFRQFSVNVVASVLEFIFIILTSTTNQHTNPYVKFLTREYYTIFLYTPYNLILSSSYSSYKKRIHVFSYIDDELLYTVLSLSI